MVDKPKMVTDRISVYLDLNYVKIPDLIKSLNEALDQVPLPYRPTAKIDIDAYDNYGSPSIESYILYERPQTPAEKAVEASRLNYQKEQELATLKRLKEKYENSRTEGKT